MEATGPIDWRACIPEPCSKPTQILIISGAGKMDCADKPKPKGKIVICKVKCDNRKIKPRPNLSKCKNWGSLSGQWKINSKKTIIADCNP